jgi:hypothetical protein
MVTDVSKDHTASIFRFKEFLRNTGTNLMTYVAPHARAIGQHQDVAASEPSFGSTGTAVVIHVNTEASNFTRCKMQETGILGWDFTQSSRQCSAYVSRVQYVHTQYCTTPPEGCSLKANNVAIALWQASCVADQLRVGGASLFMHNYNYPSLFRRTASTCRSVLGIPSHSCGAPQEASSHYLHIYILIMWQGLRPFLCIYWHLI